MLKKILPLLVPAILASAQVATAEEPRSEEQRASMRQDRNEANEVLRDSQAGYKALTSDPAKKIPNNVLKNAQCVAIFPKVTSVAVGVGGAHGSGVAFCKTAAKQWSNPVFLNLNGGSLGAQLGVRTTDLVLFMNGSESRKQLTKGNITLGGELSAVFGTHDESVTAPEKGVIAYSQNEGAFAGASLGGIILSRDVEDEKAFYGTNTKGDPFDSKVPAGNLISTDAMRSLLPM